MNCITGLPRNYGERCYKPPSEPPCIIYQLCSKHDGILVEAKGIKEYCWKKHITKLFERKVRYTQGRLANSVRKEWLFLINNRVIIMI